MLKLARKYHKWLMYFIGIQFLIWSLSGLYMVSQDIHGIHGESVLNKASAIDLDKVRFSINELLQRYPDAKNVQLQAYANRQVYRLQSDQHDNKWLLIDAVSGDLLNTIDRQMAIDIAKRRITLAANDANDANTANNANKANKANNSNIASIELLSAQHPVEEISPRKLPVWQVQFDDGLATTVYIDHFSGEVVNIRHHLWRIFDWMWRLHIVDYDDGADINNPYLWGLSILALLATLAGLILTIKWLANKFSRITTLSSADGTKQLLRVRSKWYQAIHKLVSALVVIQFLLWLISGLYLAGFSEKVVLPKQPQWPQNWANSLANTSRLLDIAMLRSKLSGQAANDQIALQSVELIWRFDAPHYLLTFYRGAHQYQPRKQLLLHAQTGQPVVLDKASVVNLAAALNPQPQHISDTKYFYGMPKDGVFSRDIAGFSNPYWRLSLADAQQTYLYIDAQHGGLIDVSTTNTRIDDLMLKLHFMDYANNGSFNHWLIICFSLLSLLMSITGVIWLLKSLQRKRLTIRKAGGFVS